MSEPNVEVPEVVGKTIQQMRIYAESDCYEIALWFSDGTSISVEIEDRTQINLKHMGVSKKGPDDIIAQMNILGNGPVIEG